MAIPILPLLGTLLRAAGTGVARAAVATKSLAKPFSSAVSAVGGTRFGARAASSAAGAVSAAGQSIPPIIPAAQRVNIPELAKKLGVERPSAQQVAIQRSIQKRHAREQEEEQEPPTTAMQGFGKEIKGLAISTGMLAGMFGAGGILMAGIQLFANKTLAASQHLETYSSTIANVNQRMRRQDLRLSVQMAARTSGSYKKLGESMMELKELSAPTAQAATNVKNMLAGFGVEIISSGFKLANLLGWNRVMEAANKMIGGDQPEEVQTHLRFYLGQMMMGSFGAINKHPAFGPRGERLF